jgi:hypothetical protein
MKEIIFIHIPRTAGRSIRAGVETACSYKCGVPHNRLCNSGHRSTIYMRDLLEKRKKGSWLTKFKFSIVRNPWDRLISWYYCFSNHRNTKKFYTQKYINVFDKWIREGAPVHPRFLYQKLNKKYHPLSSSSYLLDYDGTLLVDYIGKFEFLDHAFAKICSVLDLPSAKLPTYGQGESARSSDYKPYYTYKTSEIVRSLFSKDIDVFGYVF